MDYSDGLTILRKIAEDEKNWRAGMQQIGGLLELAQRADASLQGLETRRAQLGRDIDRLQKEQAALEATVQETRKSLDGFTGELAARESEKRAVLGSLNAQIREKEGALASITAAFDEFKKSHGMA